MLKRNELIRLRQAFEKDINNILDEQLLAKLRKLINEPTKVYEVNNDLYHSKKKAIETNLPFKERVVL